MMLAMTMNRTVRRPLLVFDSVETIQHPSPGHRCHCRRSCPATGRLSQRKEFSGQAHRLLRALRQVPAPAGRRGQWSLEQASPTAAHFGFRSTSALKSRSTCSQASPVTIAGIRLFALWPRLDIALWSRAVSAGIAESPRWVSWALRRLRLSLWFGGTQPFPSLQRPIINDGRRPSPRSGSS